VLSARIVKAGYTAVIVENELVGGDCPFWACVPSKVLLRSPEVLQAAQDVGGARERTQTGTGVDVAATFKRRDAITRNWDDSAGLIPMIEGNGVSIVRGTGKIVGEKQVQVSPHTGEPFTLTARLAVGLCTGSEPIIPDVPGLREADPWTPRDATSAEEVPAHLIIIGAGVVGCEMATAYIGYGAKITMIGRSGSILTNMDDEAGLIVQKALESKGVKFLLNKEIKAVDRKASDKVVITFSSGDSVTGTEILVTTGRTAKLDQLGLETVGAQQSGRFIKVDESLCVKTNSGRWLYGAGDINGRAPLTHSSKYHGAIAANAILTEANGSHKADSSDWSSTAATADHYAVPQVIFTDPPIASVGLTRKSAKAKGIKVREVTAPLSSPGYMIHSDKPSDSWAQWLLDDEERLLGATFVGTDAAELLHASTVAVVGGVKLGRLMHAIPSFPSLSWVYYNLMDAAGV